MQNFPFNLNDVGHVIFTIYVVPTYLHIQLPIFALYKHLLSFMFSFFHSQFFPLFCIFATFVLAYIIIFPSICVHRVH